MVNPNQKVFGCSGFPGYSERELHHSVTKIELPLIARAFRFKSGSGSRVRAVRERPITNSDESGIIMSPSERVSPGRLAGW